MKKTVTTHKLNTHDLALIQSSVPPVRFNSPSELFYEGQIPHGCFVLVEGDIYLLKRTRLFKRIESGSLFGLSEVLNDLPAACTAQIAPDSHICILNKSTLFEALDDTQHPINNLLLKLKRS